MDKEILIHQFAETASLMIWEQKAVLTNTNEPFKLVSGNYSPIYINCRKLISSPTFLSIFSSCTRVMVEARDIFFEVIAGGETGGIPYAFSLARDIGIPGIYVRKASKSHGVVGKVEGVFGNGDSVLLVEDLVTDGKSKFGFIESIKKAGGYVEDILTVFDRQQGAKNLLLKRNIRLHSLTNLNLTLNIGVEEKFITNQEGKEIHYYLNNPKQWHEERGLEYKG
jgi:orotate phosphoribosyltransferase